MAFNIRNLESGTFADNERPSQNLITYNLNSRPSGTDNQQWNIALDDKPSTTPLYRISSLAGGRFLVTNATGRQLLVTGNQDNASLFELIAKKVDVSFGAYIIRDRVSGLVWTLPSNSLRTQVTLADYNGSANQAWVLQAVISTK